jgi:hypothetical protein
VWFIARPWQTLILWLKYSSVFTVKFSCRFRRRPLASQGVRTFGSSDATAAWGKIQTRNIKANVVNNGLTRGFCPFPFRIYLPFLSMPLNNFEQGDVSSSRSNFY